MQGTARAPITFMIYGIPNHADAPSLQMLFQQKVERGVFFGSGPTRFALVELNDVVFAQHLAEAVKHHRLVHDARQAELGDEAKEEEPEDEKERPAHRAVAYLLKIKWGQEPLHIVQSSVRIDDLYATGGTVREEEPEDDFQKRKAEMSTKGRTERRKCAPSAGPESGDQSQKRPREEEAGGGTQAGAPPPPAEEKKVFPKDCCQKCGSKDHFTRNCDGSGPPQAQAAAPAQTTAAASPPPAPAPVAAPKPAFPKDCCQKCGSKNHFTRNCDGAGPAAEPAQQEPQQQPRVAKAAPAAASSAAEEPAKAKAAPPSFARTSKDQCKHCGSAAHLSRQCPTK